MISFEDFKPVAGTPIYLQILTYVKRGCVAGSIVNGDELPSRRVLSALLGINPNTVQKAFHLLEEEGLIESVSGSRSFMTVDDQKVEQLKTELLTDDIRDITTALKQMGFSKDEAVELIERYWEAD